MRVVIAPDKFRGSLGAREAAERIAAGLRAGFSGSLELVIVPMADGGEGTVEAFVEAGAARVEAPAHDALGRSCSSYFALDGDVAIIEIAAACGLLLLAPGERDPCAASSYGVGELIAAALARGAKHIVAGLGGSATNDGGAGLLGALGVRFYDACGALLAPGVLALRDLARIDRSQLDPRLRSVTVAGACDVENPLTGPRGASAIFGPQKGASPRAVAALDAALSHYADVVASETGRDVRELAGAGAAGGIGFALAAFLGARLLPGVDAIAEARGLADALKGADYCFTGEGSIDGQTLAGKTVAGVARYAARARVRKTIAFGGRIEAQAERELAALGTISVPLADGPLDLAASLAGAGALLERAAERTARLLA